MNNLFNQPGYTYGNLAAGDGIYGYGNSEAGGDYNIWGSVGANNPYVQPSGNSYTKGSPIIQNPLSGTTLLPSYVSDSGGSSIEDLKEGDKVSYGNWNDVTTAQKTLLNLAMPGASVVLDLLHGVNPVGFGGNLPWHDGSDYTGDWSGIDTSEGTTAGDYAEAGFSPEDMDFATSFDE